MSFIWHTFELSFFFGVPYMVLHLIMLHNFSCFTHFANKIIICFVLHFLLSHAKFAIITFS